MMTAVRLVGGGAVSWAGPTYRWLGHVDGVELTA